MEVGRTGTNQMDAEGVVKKKKDKNGTKGVYGRRKRL